MKRLHWIILVLSASLVFVGCDKDSDGDSIIDSEDNCPYAVNPQQDDWDGDGEGDVCDRDYDNDGWDDPQDNCYARHNPGQEDEDGDNIGDACDPDFSGGSGTPDDPDDSEFWECRPGAERPCGTSVGECTVGSEVCNDDGYWGVCSGNMPEAEECNNRDDNCNGSIDEDCECRHGTERPCGTSLGLCTLGVQVCDDGIWGLCDGTPPESEVCDDEDNDCDGTVDEGCECTDDETRSCGSDMGACVSGVQTCSRGRWGDCEGAIGPDSEVCDEIDNNCDGYIDEGLLNACGECGPVPAEQCDTLDNDCDGDIDEGCTCVDDDIQPCGTDLGECERGTQVCARGRWGPCFDEVRPTSERCDTLDNDCDGDIDENCTCVDGMTQSCGSDVGECEPGIQTCLDGHWGECVGAVTERPEDCTNDLDDNCDGYINEDCECTPGDTRSCGTDVGACTSGLETCESGRYWSPCVGAFFGDSESCNGVDDDCDGDIDEGCECLEGEERLCGSDLGQCEFGVQTCFLGRWRACEGETRPRSEVCDSLDNDCDGSVDEGCSCTHGDTRECGLDTGDCETGFQECVDGHWTLCDGIMPEAEECDGHDNDCDGDVDEGLLNACGTCGPVPPEVCDGEDNDCDGEVDEGLLNACGECGPVPAEDCDGVDNDCDGDIDEGCECIDGLSQPCGSDLGECERGTQICFSGDWSPCFDEVGPESELCDGLDNDCDGDVDEGLLNACGECGPVPAEVCDSVDNDCDGTVDEGCDCRHGSERPCGTSLGICTFGVQICDRGIWGLCDGTPPESEICDDVDNDCDGAVDEGCECTDGETRVCGSDMGACSPGTQTCIGDHWGDCEGATEPRPEVCDSIDNDCDGDVDEGLLNACGTCGPVPPEVCDGEDNDCDGEVDEGLLNACGECGPVPPEICDGVDNNCDGYIDEGCFPVEPPEDENTITCLDLGAEVEVTINGDISTTLVTPVPLGEGVTVVAIGTDLDGCWDTSFDCYSQAYLGDDADYVFVFPHTRFTPRVRTDGDSVIYFNLDPTLWDVSGDCHIEATPEGHIIDAL